MRSLVHLFLLAVLTYRGTGQVISQPDDVIICEGEGVVFTCVLNSNIRSDDVQWYRFIKDTSTTVMVDPNGENINFLTNTNYNGGSTINNRDASNNGSTVNNGSTALISNENETCSSLTITNAMKSYTGYFWVGTSSLNVCNASLTVLASPPALTVNITKNITNSSIVVQWDAVDDFLPTTYTVTWTDKKDLYEVTTLIEQTSYTITGLTLDTVYTITVTPSNGICDQGPEFRTSVSLSADSTSTTSTISPTVTASTNTVIIMSTSNPNSDSNPSTTTMTTNSITTTVNGIADNSASRNSDTSMATTTSSTIATNIAVSSTNIPTTDETSDSSSNVGIIAGAAAAVGGIIIAITIVLIIFIVCYFGRRKNAEKNNYNDLLGDGTLKSTSSVPNPLDTNNQLGKSVSSQQSEVLHMTSDMKPPQKKIETQHQQTMEYAEIDNSKKKEQEHQNREADTQLQQPMEYAVTVMDNSEKKNKKGDKQQSGRTDAQHQPMEYAVVDKSKKKNRKKDKQQNADQEPSDVPIGSTSDSANQNKNNPLLHYAELDTLPAPTDNFINENNSRTPYALVS